MRIVLCILSVLLLCPWHMGRTSHALPSPLPDSATTQEEPKEKKPDLDQAVTILIQQEVRRTLEEHKQETASTQQGQHYSTIRLIDDWFAGGLATIDFLGERLGYQLKGLHRLPEIHDAITSLLSKEQPGNHLLLRLIMVILGAGTIELLARFLLSPVKAFTARCQVESVPQRGGQLLAAVVVETLAILIYAYASLGLYYLLLPQNEACRLVAYPLLRATYIIRIIQLMATVLLMPHNARLRFIPLADRGARFLFAWLMAGSIPIVLLSSLGMLVNRLHLDESLFLALIGLVIVATSLVFLALILVSKTLVRLTIEQSEQAMVDNRSPVVLLAAKHWHQGAIALTLLMMLVWELRLLSTGKIYFGKILLSSLVFIFLFAVDYWGQRLFQLAFTPRRDGTQTEATKPLLAQMRLSDYSMRLRTAYRILLLAFAIFLLFSFWEINVTLGRIFTLSALLVLTILILAYLLWNLFRIWIDSRIADEVPEQEDVEEGGRGGSRRGTLLLLLRKAVLAVLFIITTMALMAALGIDIIPLIAGAGILGLAISFGAQSLIADIFAGIFFLIDDAFRVGDYVDCNGTMGTVEHISLRSLRLRHHRGMVHTIPFGKIGSITNYSRDYIIMKLDLRVRYDTDVDKVRKIIKRIYQDLAQDPEYGDRLIGKLKSQGVRHMDDSAMIMRVKFTTRPGDQFLLRKEVYRRIQEAFQEHGIQFAHRNVTVYVPPDQDDPATSHKKRQGAAAAAAMLQAEQGQPDTPQSDHP